MTQPTRSDNTPGTAVILAAMGLFVLLGMPLVYIIWDTLNQVLTGNLAAVRLKLFLPTIVAFAVVLVVLVRVLRHWFGNG